MAKEKDIVWAAVTEAGAFSDLSEVTETELEAQMIELEEEDEV